MSLLTLKKPFLGQPQEQESKATEVTYRAWQVQSMQQLPADSSSCSPLEAASGRLYLETPSSYLGFLCPSPLVSHDRAADTTHGESCLDWSDGCVLMIHTK